MSSNIQEKKAQNIDGIRVEACKLAQNELRWTFSRALYGQVVKQEKMGRFFVGRIKQWFFQPLRVGHSSYISIWEFCS